MATQPYTGPSIVDRHFNAAFAKARHNIFDDKDFIGFIPPIGMKFLFEFLAQWDGNSPKTAVATRSIILNKWNCKKPLRSGFHSLVIWYLRQFQKPAHGNENPEPTLDLFSVKTLNEPATEASAQLEEVQPLWEQAESSENWDVWICRRTREIHLFHKRTLTRSESLFTATCLDLGSVSVEGRPCRLKQHVDLHRTKGGATLYRILSGRL